MFQTLTGEQPTPILPASEIEQLPISDDCFFDSHRMIELSVKRVGSAEVIKDCVNHALHQTSSNFRENRTPSGDYFVPQF